MNDLTTEVNKASSDLAMKLGAKMDEVLLAEIESRGLSKEQVIRRGTFLKYPDGHEDFCYDGIPVLRFYPATLREVRLDDGAHKLVAEFRVERL